MDGLKRCFKCGTDKPRGEFYRHSEMADGLLGKCKACTKIDARVHRSTSPRARAYDRERAKLPHRKAHNAKVLREWRQRHKDRQAAHNKANRTKWTAPANCEGCCLPKRLEKHHPDYSKPLLVMWLCKPCHVLADKIRRRLEAS